MDVGFQVYQNTWIKLFYMTKPYNSLQNEMLRRFVVQSEPIHKIQMGVTAYRT
jgi:hypothetical protein